MASHRAHNPEIEGSSPSLGTILRPISRGKGGPTDVAASVLNGLVDRVGEYRGDGHRGRYTLEET